MSRLDPTPDVLLGLDYGEEITVHLADGRSIKATVYNPRHPQLGIEQGGNGRVNVPVKIRGASRVLTAYHEDKNPDRRKDVTYLQVPSIYSHERAEVEALER